MQRKDSTVRHAGRAAGPHDDIRMARRRNADGQLDRGPGATRIHGAPLDRCASFEREADRLRRLFGSAEDDDERSSQGLSVPVEAQAGILVRSGPAVGGHTLARPLQAIAPRGTHEP